MQNETITLENSRPSSYKFKHTLRLWPSNLTSRYLPQKMKACVHTETWIQVVWYSHLFQNFPQFLVIRTVIGFGIVNKAEIDVFLELLLFPWSSRCWLRWSSGCLVPLPFLKPAWTSGRSWFTYCWSLAWRILSITLLACGMSAIVW